jgi:hypothetical protein
LPLSIYIIALSPEELQAIELYQDKNGMVWIKQMALGPRLLNWLFFHANTVGHDWCVPSQYLKTIGPVPAIFSFETDGLGVDYFKSYAQSRDFSGELWDATSNYEVALKFMEEDASDFIRFVNGHRN